VRGEYIRTAKNQMVEDFYARFGFTQIGGDQDHSHWELDTASYQIEETFIEVLAPELALTE
jgi:predicted enzyme involved in methoxymalonyl-ACP biosynthesis